MIVAGGRCWFAMREKYCGWWLIWCGRKTLLLVANRTERMARVNQAGRAHLPVTPMEDLSLFFLKTRKLATKLAAIPHLHACTGIAWCLCFRLLFALHVIVECLEMWECFSNLTSSDRGTIVSVYTNLKKKKKEKRITTPTKLSRQAGSRSSAQKHMRPEHRPAAGSPLAAVAGVQATTGRACTVG